MSSGERAAYIAYNVIWWVPVVLALVGAISYYAGAVSFFIISAIRAAMIVYRVNVLSVDDAQRFPLRSP